MTERYDGSLRAVFTELRPWYWPIGVAWIAAVRLIEWGHARVSARDEDCER